MCFEQKYIKIDVMFGRFAGQLEKIGTVLRVNYRKFLNLIDTPFIDAIIHLCLK